MITVDESLIKHYECIEKLYDASMKQPNLLCLFGWHRWKRYDNAKYCLRCQSIIISGLPSGPEPNINVGISIRRGGHS